MKKIKFIKSPVGLFHLAYFVGDIVDVPANLAEVLIEAEYAVEVKAERFPAADIPVDIPGYDALLANGIKTLSEVRMINDLTELKGIGKKTAEAIRIYLK